MIIIYLRFLLIPERLTFMNNLLVVYVCISDSTIFHLPLHLCIYMYVFSDNGIRCHILKLVLIM